MSSPVCVFLFIAVVGLNCALANPQLSNPWETCSWTEGKGGDCTVGEQSRPFEEFLTPGAWSHAADLFSGEFQWDIRQPEKSHFAVTWGEVGKLGPARIRTVRYAAEGVPFASMLLAQRGDNKFAPLMKWSGKMPSAILRRSDGTEVLLLSKNFGGNVLDVHTWAWLWGTQGPVRLDLSAAVAEAIAKVAPGYRGYATELDWNSLHYTTWVWKDEWPGKTGVKAQLELWFHLGPEGLVVQRGELRE